MEEQNTTETGDSLLITQWSVQQPDLPSVQEHHDV